MKNIKRSVLSLSILAVLFGLNGQITKIDTNNISQVAIPDRDLH